MSHDDLGTSTIRATLDELARSLEMARATSRGLREKLSRSENEERMLLAAIEPLRSLMSARSPCEPPAERTAVFPEIGALAVVEEPALDSDDGLADAVDAVFASSAEPIMLGKIINAVCERWPRMKNGDALRRFLYSHPERGWTVKGTGRGARWTRKKATTEEAAA